MCYKTFISEFLNTHSPLFSKIQRTPCGDSDLIFVDLHTGIPGRLLTEWTDPKIFLHPKIVLSACGQELDFTLSDLCFKLSNLSFNPLCVFTS